MTASRTSCCGLPDCLALNMTNDEWPYYRHIYSEKTWAWWLNHMGTFVIFIISLIGNILCLFVLCRKRLIAYSYTQYLIALTIVDTGAIVCEVLAAHDKFRTPFQHSALSCKLYYYIRYIFYSLSSWIIVVLQIERLIAIKYPLWAKHLCSVPNARRILIVVFLVAMILQSYHFIVKGLDCDHLWTKTKGHCRCKTLRGYARFDTIVTVYIWRFILMTSVPLMSIIIANILIVHTLYNQIMPNDSGIGTQRNMLVRHRISKMLVLLSSVYMILYTPGSILEILKFVVMPKLCNYKWHYYILIMDDTFDLLTNLNYGINFYLYIIGGSHIRNEFLRTFKRHSNRDSSSSLPLLQRFSLSYFHDKLTNNQHFAARRRTTTRSSEL